MNMKGMERDSGCQSLKLQEGVDYKAMIHDTCIWKNPQNFYQKEGILMEKKTLKKGGGESTKEICAFQFNKKIQKQMEKITYIHTTEKHNQLVVYIFPEFSFHIDK